MGDDGSQDSSIILNVVSELPVLSSAVKVVKSTITLPTIDDISKIDSKIIYNSEFLKKNMLMMTL